MGGQRIRKYSAKMTPQAKKMTFFRIFFFSCTSTHQGATFLFLSKFHIFSRSEKSWGDKNTKKYRLKWRRRPKKWLFFGFFFPLAHLHIEAQLFCFYQNLISSAVQRYHGGQNSVTTNKQQTTNKQRTPRTIIIARQDSFRILGLIKQNVQTNLDGIKLNILNLNCYYV